MYGHLSITTACPDHTGEMDQSGNLVSRKAEGLVTEALADTCVVTLNGARQAGKSTRLGEPDGAAGPMMETFVLMELARQLTWCQERARLYHYRTKDKT